jgi:hypothetical protein
MEASKQEEANTPKWKLGPPTGRQVCRPETDRLQKKPKMQMPYTDG